MVPGVAEGSGVGCALGSALSAGAEEDADGDGPAVGVPPSEESAVTAKYTMTAMTIAITAASAIQSQVLRRLPCTDPSGSPTMIVPSAPHAAVMSTDAVILSDGHDH